MVTNTEDRILLFERALLSLDSDVARGMLTDPAGRSVSYAEAESLIVPALERIGRGWEDGSVALSQVYMSGRICESLMDALKPAAAAGSGKGPRMAIAVLEDYHLLGMRMVSSVLRASGFELGMYGRMDVEGLVKRAIEDRIEVLLVSVLMLRSALRVRELRRSLDDSGLRVALAVGGAPFRLDGELWREVGADGTADTAGGAVTLVKRLAEGLEP